MLLTETGSAGAHDEVFVGTSEMAALMRRRDWASTPLGPVDAWPQGLKVALRLLLTSRFEMWMGWGPDVAVFYNDAYRPTLGEKHPRSLGLPMRELWAEVYEDVRDRVESVYREGRATWDRGLLLLLERSGYREETYHTFSYSPLYGDTGRVEGLFCTVTEETHRVLSERRLATLGSLAGGLARAGSRREVLDAVSGALARADRDLPFTLCYLIDPVGPARLAASTGLPDGHPFASPGADPSRWQFERLEPGGSGLLLPLSAADGPMLPTGAWDRAADTAIVLPLGAQGEAGLAGFLVCALNPYRRHDADMQDFLGLVAGQIAAGLANATAVEMTRRRSEELAEAMRLRQAAAELLEASNLRLAAEVQARTAERDRLRELFQQTPGFVCVLRGPDHRFEMQNESYLQVVGHRDLTGRTVREALPELAGQGFYELLDEVYASGRPYVGRGVGVMLQRQPGAPLEQRFLNFVYQPIRATDGGVEGVFTEGHDVTDQILAERELIALNGTLEARINERTEALADALQRLRTESAERESVQEALRQSQKMDAVGQLTGGIAHDFNNLLQGITGSLELVRRRVQQGRGGEIERFIGDAIASAKRAASLTHRLLAFSRRQPLDPKPVKANPLISSMEDLLRRTMGERIALELVLAGGLWVTLCDANQLESAVLNLCINARDAMPDGGRLTIETANAHLDRGYALHAGLAPGQYVCIGVTDTGTGMTPDVVSRAFDPFFTTKPLGQGTGLGLSMIYGFARQSEGHARIYSEPGRGTTVRLYLPRHRGEAAEDEAPAPAAAGEHATEDGETVLVIEDEEVVRGLIVEILHELGYRAIEAADGPSGLEILMSPRKIDLLVTDIGLPGLNGRQVADAARLARPELKVLFMTGYAENAAFAGGFLEPGMAMMTKPFAMEALALRLREMMLAPARGA